MRIHKWNFEEGLPQTFPNHFDYILIESSGDALQDLSSLCDLYVRVLAGLLLLSLAWPRAGDGQAPASYSRGGGGGLRCAPPATAA